MSAELFERFNHTELLQMTRKAGMSVSPLHAKNDLIKLLLGEIEPPTQVCELDKWRNGIMGFLLEHWRMVETQLTCPAKSKDPKACFNCLDQQVIMCLVQNKNDIGLIQVHKKDR